MPSVADRVVQLIREWEVADEDYLLTRQDVVAPNPPHGRLAKTGEFAWIEVMGEARTHSRPLGLYLALMAVAAGFRAVRGVTGKPIPVGGGKGGRPRPFSVSSPLGRGGARGPRPGPAGAPAPL